MRNVFDNAFDFIGSEFSAVHMVHAAEVAGHRAAAHSDGKSRAAARVTDHRRRNAERVLQTDREYAGRVQR